jgi:hypothetical protein
MKFFLKKIIFYGFLALILFNAIALTCLYILRNSSFYKPEFLVHEVKNEHFDYIVIGSSIGLASLNTTQIDSSINSKGLNLSMDDTSLSSNYLMLQHFYKHNKKVKFCILAINYWDVSNEKPKMKINDYRFLPFVNEDYVFNYYNEGEATRFKPLTWSRNMPIIGVSYFNTEIFYPALVALFKPEYKNRFDGDGNYAFPSTTNLKYKQKADLQLNWRNPFLDKIKKLCCDNHTQLIVYQAPNYDKKIINKNRNFNLINHSDSIISTKYFYDEVHLNSKGRKLESRAFANELKLLMFKK